MIQQPQRHHYYFHHYRKPGQFWLCAVVVVMLGLWTTMTAAQNTTADPSPVIDSAATYKKELDKWMLQAYEGDRDAQFKVGVLYTHAQFAKPDFEQAVYWYKQAARQGHVLAQYNLGHQYLTGVGVKRSESTAMSWWLKAAEQDHPLAQFNIGRAYYLGIGLEKNETLSRQWFERAARNKEPKSIEILTQLGWAEPGQYDSTEPATPSAQAEPSAPVQITERTTPVTPPASETAKPDNQDDAEISSSIIVAQDLGTPPNDSSKEQEPAAATNTQATTQPAAQSSQPKPQTNPIAIYTDPAVRNILIAIEDIRADLKTVSKQGEWTKVSSDKGFPVWVHSNYLAVADNIGTITGDTVNARSVPIVTKGSIVGRLNKDEMLLILDKRDDWYRLQSPARFQAWVKTEEFTKPPITPTQSTPESASSWITAVSQDNRPQNNTKPANQRVQQTTSASGDGINDNEWLFSQPAENYTLQLASFDDQEKVLEFMSRKKFVGNPDLHRFTATGKDKNIEWTYFLYGSYRDADTARKTRDQIGQKLAWIRSFGKLQENRCVAWKKQIPTPSDLNKYCVQ